MRIAVVGTGISGLVCAHKLHPEHEVTLFEADDRPGGHTHTHTIEDERGSWRVDSGFIVCNDRTYPNFLALLDELGVETRETLMSFSASSRTHDFEYHGDSVNGLFAQRRNAVDPRFLRMVLEYPRFNRVARAFLESGDETTSLRDLLDREGFSDWFVERLLVPQAAAVWSADPRQMWSFPAMFLVRFFANHGMLSLMDRPTWMTVRGGSRAYMDALLAPLGDRLRLSSPVERVVRTADGVELTVGGPHGGGEPEAFDHVILACHSDQALSALGDDATDDEREVLGAIPYRESEAVLHTDAAIMPTRRRAWSSWNTHLDAGEDDRPRVTYDMNRLQGIGAPDELLVSLNMTDAIDPSRVLRTMRYAHPVFTPDGTIAQRRWSEVSGSPRTGRRTHFAGAYWRWGFHEDGVWSALRVCRALGLDAPDLGEGRLDAAPVPEPAA